MKLVKGVFIIMIASITFLYGKGGLEREIVEARNDFAFSLFGKLVQDNQIDNVIFSPLSVHLALTMVLNGAEDETKEQIAKTLGLNSKELISINKFNSSYLRNIQEQSDGTSYLMANSLWLGEDYGLSIEYAKMMNIFYNANVSNVDFGKADAKEKINDWISQNTAGIIEDMIEETNPADILYIINAIYFKSKWEKAFDTAETYQDIFYVDNRQEITVDMMNRKDNIWLYIDENLQAFHLDFKGDFTITFIMPESSFDDYCLNLEKDEYNRIKEKLHKKEAIIHMPRLDTKFKTPLNKTLESMGMKAAFDPAKADFGGILENASSDIFIELVLHQAAIKLDEEGAEAAAATVVELAKSAAPTSIETIKLDKPFLFNIEEKRTGTVIFSGIIRNPNK
ncbi:MAG: serpin family protein [Candidatus Zixiibacteriota bacterium]